MMYNTKKQACAAFKITKAYNRVEFHKCMNIILCCIYPRNHKLKEYEAMKKVNETMLLLNQTLKFVLYKYA